MKDKQRLGCLVPYLVFRATFDNNKKKGCSVATETRPEDKLVFAFPFVLRAVLQLPLNYLTFLFNVDEYFRPVIGSH